MSCVDSETESKASDSVGAPHGDGDIHPDILRMIEESNEANINTIRAEPLPSSAIQEKKNREKELNRDRQQRWRDNRKQNGAQSVKKIEVTEEERKRRHALKVATYRAKNQYSTLRKNETELRYFLNVQNHIQSRKPRTDLTGESEENKRNHRLSRLRKTSALYRRKQKEQNLKTSLP